MHLIFLRRIFLLWNNFSGIWRKILVLHTSNYHVKLFKQYFTKYSTTTIREDLEFGKTQSAMQSIPSKNQLTSQSTINRFSKNYPICCIIRSIQFLEIICLWKFMVTARTTGNCCIWCLEIMSIPMLRKWEISTTKLMINFWRICSKNVRRKILSFFSKITRLHFWNGSSRDKKNF